MFFSPDIGDTLQIERHTYAFTEHPQAPGTVHLQEGRRATVYRIQRAGEDLALKVFKHKFQRPEIAESAQGLAYYQSVPGLKVAKRSAILSPKHQVLIEQERSLEYAILMPWIEGENWEHFVWKKKPLTSAQSLRLAKGLVMVMVGLERRGIAHCDLASSNFIFSPDFEQVELVDIEELYSHRLNQPSSPPAGTPGYAPEWAAQGLWSAEADRFATTLLLSEILGWQFAEVRESRHGQSYFDPQEIGRKTTRLTTLVGNIQKLDSKLAQLLMNTWEAQNLEACPPISEWKSAIDCVVKISGPQRATEDVDESPTPEPEWEPLSLSQVPPSNVRLGMSPNAQLPSARIQPAGLAGKRFGGLTQNQFIATLVAFPVLALVSGVWLGPLLKGTWLWSTVAPTALLAPAIYMALRRPWLTFFCYVPAVMLGAMQNASISGYDYPAGTFFLAAVVGGLIFEGITWLSHQIFPEQNKLRSQQAMSMAVGGWASTCGVYGVIYGPTSWLRFDFLVVNLFIGILGWLLGVYLYQAVIYLRETTRGD